MYEKKLGIVKHYVARLCKLAEHVLVQSRPWNEMIDAASLCRPVSLHDALSRLKKNAHYFKVNYFIVILSIFCALLLTKPRSVATLAASLAVWLVLFQEESAFSETQKRIFSTIMGVGVVFFLTETGSVLVQALFGGGICIAAHGCFRTPDDLFLDDVNGATFFDFLHKPTNSPLSQV